MSIDGPWPSQGSSSLGVTAVTFFIGPAESPTPRGRQPRHAPNLYPEIKEMSHKPVASSGDAPLQFSIRLFSFGAASSFPIGTVVDIAALCKRSIRHNAAPVYMARNRWDGATG